MIRSLLQGGTTKVSKIYLRHASISNNNTTIDDKEVEHFKKSSNIWWAKDSPYKMLQHMNTIRVPYIQNALVIDGVVTKEAALTEKPLRGVKLLDAGCGGGFLSEALAHLGAKTTGLDAGRDLVEVAKAHMETDKELTTVLNYCHASIEDFALTNEGAFDAVVSSEVIEHVVTKKEFLDAFVKCCKPGGTVVMTTIAQTWRAYMKAIIMCENVFGVIPRGTHEYDKLIRVADLQRLLEECGCTIKGVQGFTYRPFKRDYKWCKHDTVHYAIHAIKK